MVKNVFGVRNDAEKIEGSAFLLREVDEQERERIDSFGETAREVLEPPARPRKFRLLATMLLYAGLMTILFGVQYGMWGGNSFWQALAARPWLFVIAAGLIAAGEAIFIRESRLEKKRETSEEARQIRTQSEELDREVYAKLNVPADAIPMDVLVYTYDMKNGKAHNGVYTAFDMRAFREEDKLCFADVGSVVGIPLSSIDSIRTEKRKLSFYFWNKGVPPDAQPYRQYRIRTGFFGAHVIREVLVLHIRSDSGEYELLIPPYESDTLSRLTGESLISAKEDSM